MVFYQVIFARSAQQELEALPWRVAERILTRIETLAETPRPRGCRKSRGQVSFGVYVLGNIG